MLTIAKWRLQRQVAVGEIAARVEGQQARRYIPTLLPLDANAKAASQTDAGAALRDRLDEKQLPQMAFPPLSESLEREFANLSAKIDVILEQFGVRIVAAEEAVATVHAMCDVEESDSEARRL